jgi:hypothetical protein
VAQDSLAGFDGEAFVVRCDGGKEFAGQGKTGVVGDMEMIHDVHQHLWVEVEQRKALRWCGPVLLLAPLLLLWFLGIV